MRYRFFSLSNPKINIPSHQEQQLLLHVAAGDETAFASLLHAYWFGIYQYSLAFLKSSELAEEFTQDVFVRLWQNRSKLTQVRQFADYLFILARNLLFTQLKKKITRHEPLDQESGAEPIWNPDQQLDAKELDELITKAVALLPPQQKSVFQYAHQQKMDYQQVADIMKISKRTVRFHMAAAVAFIRSYIYFEYGNSPDK